MVYRIVSIIHHPGLRMEADFILVSYFSLHYTFLTHLRSSEERMCITHPGSPPQLLEKVEKNKKLLFFSLFSAVVLLRVT